MKYTIVFDLKESDDMDLYNGKVYMVSGSNPFAEDGGTKINIIYTNDPEVAIKSWCRNAAKYPACSAL